MRIADVESIFHMKCKCDMGIATLIQIADRQIRNNTILRNSQLAEKPYKRPH